MTLQNTERCRGTRSLWQGTHWILVPCSAHLDHSRGLKLLALGQLALAQTWFHFRGRRDIPSMVSRFDGSRSEQSVSGGRRDFIVGCRVSTDQRGEQDAWGGRSERTCARRQHSVVNPHTSTVTFTSGAARSQNQRFAAGITQQQY